MERLVEEEIMKIGLKREDAHYRSKCSVDVNMIVALSGFVIVDFSFHSKTLELHHAVCLSVSVSTPRP